MQKTIKFVVGLLLVGLIICLLYKWLKKDDSRPLLLDQWLAYNTSSTTVSAIHNLVNVVLQTNSLTKPYLNQALKNVMNAQNIVSSTDLFNFLDQTDLVPNALLYSEQVRVMLADPANSDFRTLIANMVYNYVNQCPIGRTRQTASDASNTTILNVVTEELNNFATNLDLRGMMTNFLITYGTAIPVDNVFTGNETYIDLPTGTYIDPNFNAVFIDNNITGGNVADSQMFTPFGQALTDSVCQ